MKLEHNIFLAFSLAVFFLITAKCDHQTPPSDYSDTTDGSDTSSRRPQDIPVELNCYIPFCDITGPLPKTSNVYNINLGSNSIIILEFPIGGSRLDIGLSLISNPAANIRTDIALFSDGNELDSLASSVTDPSWEKYYTINQSRFRDRRLAVQIRSNSQAEGSYVQFKIQQRPSSDDDGPEIWVIGVSLAAAVFVFIVLTTCCCYAYTRRRRQRRPRTALPVTDRQDPPAERAPVMMKQSKNKDQLSAENLDQRFPEAPFSSFYSFFEQKTCSICLEELKYDQSCRQLYCEHIFHAECIKLWILNQLKKGNACCPNCNKDVSKTKEMKKTFFKHAKRTKIEV